MSTLDLEVPDRFVAVLVRLAEQPTVSETLRTDAAAYLTRHRLAEPAPDGGRGHVITAEGLRYLELVGPSDSADVFPPVVEQAISALLAHPVEGLQSRADALRHIQSVGALAVLADPSAPPAPTTIAQAGGISVRRNGNLLAWCDLAALAGLPVQAAARRPARVRHLILPAPPGIVWQRCLGRPPRFVVRFEDLAELIDLLDADGFAIAKHHEALIGDAPPAAPRKPASVSEVGAYSARPAEAGAYAIQHRKTRAVYIGATRNCRTHWPQLVHALRRKTRKADGLTELWAADPDPAAFLWILVHTVADPNVEALATAEAELFSASTAAGLTVVNAAEISAGGYRARARGWGGAARPQAARHCPEGQKGRP